MENPERVTYFAATDARGKHIPFGIKQKDRSKHLYVIGKTGMGKSTLLENMAIQDIRNGEGLAFIDPHGGTAEKILEYIPEDRIDDVVYFAPFDMEHPIAFNVMEDVGYDKRHLVVSGLMATFKKIWVDAWSARMEYILSNTLLALLEYPDATLLGVNRMYTDKAYRKLVVDNVKDPMVKDFWTKEFAGYTDRYTQEATPAIQNKIGQFTGNPLIRNIIGQSKSSFDIREIMDKKKILIINLSKGLVGDTNMQLIGSMLTTRIFLAAMSRADVTGPALTRLANFYFYVDEFQNFANETFAEILSEARKYKLNLIIAHQYIEQMEEEVRDAVFGNVGTTIVFRVGPFDAEVLETVFLPEFTKEDLVNLGFAQIYLSLMIDGVGSRPFSAVTIAPIEPPVQTFKEQVIDASRKHFGNLRAGVEQIITKSLAPVANAPSPTSSQRPPQKNYSHTSSQSKTPPPVKTPHANANANVNANTQHTNTRTNYSTVQKKESVPQRSVKAPEKTTPPPVISAPRAATDEKTVGDLKSILHSMKRGIKLTEVNKKDSNKQELKTALSSAFKQRESQKPVNPTPQNYKKDTPSPSTPFEVSEATLRKVFKGDA